MSERTKLARRLGIIAVKSDNYDTVIRVLPKCNWNQRIALFHELFTAAPRHRALFVSNLFDEFVASEHWVYMVFLLQAQRNMFMRCEMDEHVDRLNRELSELLVNQDMK
jgi:hypothetical protein